jgi:putative transposase
LGSPGEAALDFLAPKGEPPRVSHSHLPCEPFDRYTKPYLFYTHSMPRSWTQNYYHLVFGTKHREPWIQSTIEPRLHRFLGGIARDLDCTPISINGVEDHVHLLIRFPATLAPADLARHLKSRSSRWVHTTFESSKSWRWQECYGGFTVSKSVVPRVDQYIKNQKKHHATQSFPDEMRDLCKLHGLPFDPAEFFA